MDAEQLALRRTGITATDIAAIVGLDPYPGRTPWHIYAEKAGIIGGQSNESERSYWGRKLQKSIAEGYSERKNRPIVWLDETVRSKDKDWQLATPDFRHEDVTDDGGEVKMVRYRDKEQWGEEGTDQVPPRVLCQVQWQMSVMRWNRVVVVLFCGGSELRTYPIYRDQELIGTLEDAGEKFWKDHVVLGSSPAIDGSYEASQYLRKKFPKVEEDLREASPGEIQMASEYKKYKALEEQADGKLKQLRNALIEKIGPAKGILGPGFKLILSEVKGSTYTVTREPTRALRAHWDD